MKVKVTFTQELVIQNLEQYLDTICDEEGIDDLANHELIDLLKEHETELLEDLADQDSDITIVEIA